MEQRYSRDRYGRGRTERERHSNDEPGYRYQAQRPRSASGDERFFGGGLSYGEGLQSPDSQGTYEELWHSRGAANEGSDRMRDDRGYRRDDGYRSRPYYSGHGSSAMSYYADDTDYPDSERGFLTDRERRGERGWWDRTTDEVASWFGDEEAESRREMDHRRADSYRGHGPKGYVRSDERITEDINDRLSYDAYLDASNIEVAVTNGEVTLSGTVHSRQQKRLAEDVAEDVSGVRNVENRLRADRSGAQFSAATHYGGGASEFEATQSKSTSA